MNDLLPRTERLYGDEVRARLRAWFVAHGRAFPWRAPHDAVEKLVDEGAVDVAVNDPYIVLVSEVMLQQTQTSRVAEKLPQFLERFPDVAALARASRGDVLRAWQGLGYNNRAVRLHETAIAIVERHGGVFPREVGELRALGGIGRYTASAIACFAFGRRVAVVDVNIERVLSRLFHRCHSVDARIPEESIWRLDAALLPPGGSYWWHQALMDHGATICTARRPSCERCPLVDLCLSAYPPDIALFGADTRDEPMIAGTPRRIWRGRIIEHLRQADSAVPVGALIDLLPRTLFERTRDEELLLALVTRLVDEQLVTIESNVVAESDTITPHTLVRLPH